MTSLVLVVVPSEAEIAVYRVAIAIVVVAGTVRSAVDMAVVGLVAEIASFPPYTL